MRKEIIVMCLIGMTLISGCGGTIKKAQDFSENLPPQIISISVSNPGNAEVIPFNAYPITVAASDPDKQTLTYTFKSDSGGVEGQASTATGCTVNFVAGDLAGGQKVKVAVTVSDNHGGYASSYIDVGTAKQGPTVTAAASRIRMRSLDTATLSVSANCEGIFQLLPDQTTAPLGIDTTADSTKPLRLYKSGTAEITVNAHNAASSADLVLPDKAPYTNTTVYNVWIVFRDALGMISTMNLPLSVDDQLPTVTFLSPSSVSSVPLAAVVQFKLSEAVDAANISSALSVTANGGKSASVSFFSYNAATCTATYTASGLAHYTSYTAKAAGIKDIAGNSISDSSLMFVTVQGASMPGITEAQISSSGQSCGGTKYTLPTGTSFAMMRSTLGDVTDTSYIPFPKGSNDNASSSISKPFSMAETQTTYELWCIVRDWAIAAKGYSFAHPGDRGFNNPTGPVTQPVTNISWHDIIIWCNALTEYYNAHRNGTGTLTCVYRALDENGNRSTDPIKSATDTSWDPIAGEVSDITDAAADGFRLPTSDEFEFAARYLKTEEIQNTPTKPLPPVWAETARTTPKATYAIYYWTLHNYASGATGPVPSSAPETFAASDMAATDEVAWTRYNTNIDAPQTRAVAQLRSNALGLYDMSGNVYQYYFEKGVRGGSSEIGMPGNAVSYHISTYWGRTYNSPFYGFRIAQNQ